MLEMVLLYIFLLSLPVWFLVSGMICAYLCVSNIAVISILSAIGYVALWPVLYCALVFATGLLILPFVVWCEHKDKRNE